MTPVNYSILSSSAADWILLVLKELNAEKCVQLIEVKKWKELEQESLKAKQELTASVATQRHAQCALLLEIVCRNLEVIYVTTSLLNKTKDGTKRPEPDTT